MTKKIGVIGTGIMGGAIAANFLKAGYQVTVWNRTPGKTAVLQSHGAKLKATPREVTADSDIIFEVTANDESSQAVWQGDTGILAGATGDKTLVASATLTVDWTEKLAMLCDQKGFVFFDMPLTGGRVAAEAGNLTLLVGGPQQILETLKPDLDAISGKLFYFGLAGSGMKYKLVLNGLQAAHIVAFGEAMKLARQVGLTTDQVGKALCDRPGGIITALAWDAYQKSEPSLSFSVDWITKDLGYLKQLAGTTATSILDDLLATYHQAQSSGHGNQDWTTVNKL